MLACCVSMVAGCSSQPSPILSAPSLINVSYHSVTALHYKVADHLIPYGPNNSQHGLLWSPMIAQEQRPLVVFIHGGCWLSEYDIAHSYPFASQLAKEGYPVWSIEYRRSGESGGGWPVTFNDVVDGIAAAGQLDSYDVDLSKIVLVGHSAGGHLALLAGAHWDTNATLQNVASQPVGTIGLAAITDIAAYSKGDNSCESVTSAFMGGSYAERRSEYEAANPAQLPQWQNTWLMHGTADGIVATEQARLNGAETIMLEGAGHFDWIHPESEAFSVLLKQLETF